MGVTLGSELGERRSAEVSASIQVERIAGLMPMAQPRVRLMITNASLAVPEGVVTMQPQMPDVDPAYAVIIMTAKPTSRNSLRKTIALLNEHNRSNTCHKYFGKYVDVNI